MIGIGYDIHKLAANKNLILGGIKIPSDFGTIAHSDGDVLIHSIIDAMLGAACLGDIGEHFPDTDPQYKNISSTELLDITNEKLIENGYIINHIDVTIILEKPNLKDYKPLIKENIALLLDILPDQVNIKAKTNEQQDSIGKQDAIAVHSICLLERVYDLYKT